MEDGNDSDSASTTASSVDTTLSDETDRVDGQGKPPYMFIYSWGVSG